MKEITSERSIGNFLKSVCTERKYKIIKLNPADHNGIPDREIYLRNGHKINVELKSKGETHRPMQERWGEWLTSNNHMYFCIDRVNDDVKADLLLLFDILDVSQNGYVPPQAYEVLSRLTTVKLKFTYS